MARAVLHRTIEKDDYNVHLYLDTSLFANEISDFTNRLEKQNANIRAAKEAEERRRSKGKGRLTDEQFEALQPLQFKDAYEDRTGIGTLALRTNDTELNGAQAYYLYKRRQSIEEFFKVYDNSLDFASSYMRNNYSEEAWLFLNHLSAMMAFQILDEIYIKGRSKDTSLKDFISSLSRIFADKVNKEWHCAKTTKKRADFAKAFNIDISALIKDMNAMEAINV